MTTNDHYDLYYWPGIPGRGEYIRLALEAASASYTDHANEGKSPETVLKLIDPGYVAQDGNLPPFAPPILKHGDLLLFQTPNILYFLGPRLGLAPDDEPGRLLVNQLHLTLADLANEVHDVHHPISVGLYYEDQKTEALRRSKDLCDNRISKFLGYFERVLNGKQWLVRDRMSYADLSLFQNIEGLYFAFPRLMKKLKDRYPQVIALHAKVLETPSLKAYLSKRLAFSDGLFRHYDELDAP